jgi:N-acetylneuraminate synthase
MSAPFLTIGTRRVGPGNPLYFIAEAGSNHNRDLDQAFRLIDVAVKAGADAVKFQTFRADKLYPRNAGITKYLKVPKSIHEIIRELEMPFEWIPRLADYCRERGIDFMSTPFDEESADALAPYVPAFKIASYEMTHHTLVQHCARKGKPLIVSTGTANLDEVREVVDAVRMMGVSELAILQCTAKYPAPLSALNLRTISTMACELGVVVGLSDHSREPLPGPMAATALGACIIEKHFTLRNDLPGPDHAYALEPHELAEVIRKIREVEQSLGTGIKEPPPEEQELRHFARRSLFTWRDVPKGERLTVANMAALRCGELPYGMHPRDFVRMLGRPVRRSLSAGTTLRLDDVDELRLRRGAVTLRPLAAGDTEHILRWRARPEVASELFSDRAPTHAEHEAWFAGLQRRTDRIELVILDEETPVGTVGLSNIDFGAKSAEYGILIGEAAARGRGVAHTASELILEHAFGSLGLERVDLTLFADNEPARRLYQKLGFSTREQLPAREKDGRLRPVELMSLARDQGASA